MRGSAWPAAVFILLLLSGASPAAAGMLDAPTATTTPATDVSITTARLHGSVNAKDDVRAATWYFEYGTTTGYGSKTPSRLVTGTASQNVLGAVGNLTPGTTYHFRLVATNLSGTSRGEDQAFTTLAVGVVETGAAEPFTPTSARLTGSVNPRGRAATWLFEYGTTTKYGTAAGGGDAGSGTAPVPVSTVLTSLAPSTTYHYRLVARSNPGTSFGADRTFTTPAAALTIAPSPRTVMFGRSVTLAGTASDGKAGRVVTVSGQESGAAAFGPIGTATTQSEGRWSLRVTPRVGTLYEVSAPDTVADRVFVTVRPSVRLSRVGGGGLRAGVAPASAFAHRTVRLERLVAHHWVRVARARLGSSGTATFAIAALPRGTSRVRVAVRTEDSAPGYLSGASSALVVRR